MSKDHELGDAPIQPEYEDKMRMLAAAIDNVFNGDTRPRKVGFVMMLFEYGDQPGRCNYISNGADRKDVVTLMKEMIARFEGQPEMTGRG